MKIIFDTTRVRAILIAAKGAGLTADEIRRKLRWPQAWDQIARVISAVSRIEVHEKRFKTEYRGRETFFSIELPPELV